MLVRIVTRSLPETAAHAFPDGKRNRSADGSDRARAYQTWLPEPTQETADAELQLCNVSPGHRHDAL